MDWDDAIERATEILQRNDAHDAYRKIESAYPEAYEEEIGELIWEVFHEGRVDFHGLQPPHRLAEAPAQYYTPDDVIDLVSEYATHYGANGRMSTGHGWTHLWHDDELPGYVGGLYELSEARADDEAFLVGLEERYEVLDSPYDDAVAYVLARLDFFSEDQLDDELLATAAETYLRHDRERNPPWRRPPPSGSAIRGPKPCSRQLGVSRAFKTPRSSRLSSITFHPRISSGWRAGFSIGRIAGPPSRPSSQRASRCPSRSNRRSGNSPQMPEVPIPAMWGRSLRSA